MTKKSYKFLIVEDSAPIAKMLKKEFGKSFKNSEVELNTTLTQAKKSIRDNEFDYIILDITLPDGVGTDLVAYSKKISNFKAKFIIFTTTQDKELKDKLYNLGVLDYILKSGNITNVVTEIKNLIEKIESHKDFNILVADDALMYRNILKQVLINRDYKVSSVKDASEAITTLDKASFDLILMDLNMPVMNGEEFLLARRKNPKLYQLPVIMLTGEDDKDLISKLLKLGANDVLQKPFSIEELIMKVDNLIQLRLAQREKESLNNKLEENVKKLNDINDKLSRYLSPQLYCSIFEGKQSVGIGSKRKKLTIFFSDIKNFTNITENMESEDLTFLLNSYLTEMSSIAIKYGATIDKFIGDAILIFFGDPDSKGVKEDALSCVSMALEMRSKMKELRQKWQQEGFVTPFEIRIGINTGYATVGNFGSENKMDYTVIGSNVNLASRLESSADVGEILMSRETYLLVKDEVDSIEKEAIIAKGFEHPIRTYQINSLKTKDTFNKALEGFYVNVNFDELKEQKEDILKTLDYLYQKVKDSN